MSPHIGRGGWTWYTGSAGWMYRLIVESVLGLRLEADKLFIEPCLPSEWDTTKIQYRYRETIYSINLLRIPEGNMKLNIILDGVAQNDNFISLVDDHQGHVVEAKLISILQT
jgi:cellobiose phosphorylase